MYTEQDAFDIRRQLARRWAAVALPGLALLAGIAFSFALRARWVTVGLTALLIFGLIFSYDMLIRPVADYARHLDQALHGRTRQTTGIVKRVEEKTVLREGVAYRSVLLNVGEKDAAEDDRLFYYDANLPPPPWQIGETITVTAHDKALCAWSRARKEEDADA